MAVLLFRGLDDRDPVDHPTKTPIKPSRLLGRRKPKKNGLWVAHGSDPLPNFDDCYFGQKDYHDGSPERSQMWRPLRLSVSVCVVRLRS
jgi:hypothetical protein